MLQKKTFQACNYRDVIYKPKWSHNCENMAERILACVVAINRVERRDNGIFVSQLKVFCFFTYLAKQISLLKQFTHLQKSNQALTTKQGLAILFFFQFHDRQSNTFLFKLLYFTFYQHSSLFFSSNHQKMKKNVDPRSQLSFWFKKHEF